MLTTIDGKQVSKVPYLDSFSTVLRLLGPDPAAQIRSALSLIIDQIPPERDTGLRTFSSSHLGSKLTPWPLPLSHIYDIAWQIVGTSATEDIAQSRAALIFGQFIWESVMNREETWAFYDPNLPGDDPNKEITGKVYFERSEST
jgi:hypothetical protein